jgi:short-subunit dehydrogenase
VQSAEDVARQGIAALARGQRTIIPNLGGRLGTLLVRLLPSTVITHAIESVVRRKAHLA